MRCECFDHGRPRAERCPHRSRRAGGVFDCAFSPDGTLIASASADQTVRVWKAASGEQLRLLKGHTDSVFGCAFSPDGRLHGSTSYDQRLMLWDVQGALGLGVG